MTGDKIIIVSNIISAKPNKRRPNIRHACKLDHIRVKWPFRVTKTPNIPLFSTYPLFIFYFIALDWRQRRRETTTMFAIYLTTILIPAECCLNCTMKHLNIEGRQWERLYLSRNNRQGSSEEIIADEGTAQLLTRKCLSRYYSALSQRGDPEKRGSWSVWNLYKLGSWV